MNIKWVPRMMEAEFARMRNEYPVVTITGPRQSGKTTLARRCCEGYAYANLESPEIRNLAIHDPKAFFNAYPAYTGSPDGAAALIMYFEDLFRGSMQTYSQAFMMDEPDDLAMVSQILAALALEAYGIVVDPTIVAGALEVAMILCSGDYLDEILATIAHVDKEMKKNHINRKYH